MRSEYGFASTSLKDIVLLEASRDGLYILFSVNENVYRFESTYKFGKENGVWVGKGTIEREESY